MKKTTFLGSAIALLLLSATPVFAEPYGWSPQTDFSGTAAPVCTDEIPGQPVLYQPFHALLAKATEKGTVRLNWHKAARANNYTIAYGLSSRNYIYGAVNVGNTDNFTVKFLSPGRTYYFAVRAVNGCMPGSFSNEWTARPVGGAVTALTPATGFLPAPKTLGVTDYQAPAPETATTVTLPTEVPANVYQPPVQAANPVVPAAPKSGGLLQGLFGFFGKLLGK